MYSVSDFERFSQRIVASAESRAKAIVTEASGYAERRLKEVEEETKRTYEEGMREIEKEATAYEKEVRAKMDTAIRVAWQEALAEKKDAVMDALENRIDREFETLAHCFLEWLTTRYHEGRIELYDRLRYEKSERFEMVPIPEKAVRLTRENLIVAFTPDSVMEEFAPLIDETLSKMLKVRH